MSRQLRSVFGADAASRRAAISAGAVLIVVLAVESVGLKSGSLGLVLVGAVAAIALAVILLRADLKRAGLYAALACAFTLTWNGWFIGPIRPGDVLILFTLVLVLAANPNDAFRIPPWWIKQLAVMIILIAVITIYFPPDPIYLANRIVLTATGKPTVSTKGAISAANLGVAFKFVVAVFATPVAFTGIAIRDRRSVRWLAVAFATGAGLSGLVATSDHLGTNLGRYLTGLPNIGNRQIGFAYQPNFLAAGLCLATPLAFWMIVTGSRRERLFGSAALIGCLGGVYASGSRGGAVSILLVLGLSMVVHKRTRVHAPYVALAGVLVGMVVATLMPDVWMKILRATRLIGGVVTAGSDSVRSIVGAQGVRDFYHSPLHGIGLQVSFDASQVYLQELASGGLILFFAMQIYMLGAIITARRRMNADPLAGALLASLLITLVLNVFEADLTDRFYYVPAAILVALMHTARTGSQDDAADEAELVSTA